MRWIQHRTHVTTQSAVVRHAPEWKCKRMYAVRHEWMAIHFMLHSAIGPTTWSGSCCGPAVLWSYCTIAEHFVHCTVMYNKLVLYRVQHLTRFFVRSDDLLNANYGRSGMEAERPILILINSIYAGFPSRCAWRETPGVTHVGGRGDEGNTAVITAFFFSRKHGQRNSRS